MTTMQATPVALPLTVDTTGAKILEGDGTSGPDQRDSRDIWLPNWVETVSHIALDVSALTRLDEGGAALTSA